MARVSMKNQYMTIFDHCVSPCRSFFAAGNNYGEVAVFEYASCPTDKNVNTPILKWSTPMGVVYCVAATPKYLIAAGDGPVLMWSWDAVMRGTQPDPISTVHLFKGGDVGEVNCMSLTPGGSTVLCGCSDGSVHEIDLASGKKKGSISGGTRALSGVGNGAAVFCVSSKDDDVFVAGSADGRVMVWDVREGSNPTFTLRPFSTVPRLDGIGGNWISALDVFGDWMVCGGSSAASLWHLGARTVSTVYKAESTNVHAVEIIPDVGRRGVEAVMVGGQGSTVTAFSLDGEVKARIPTSSTCVYSLRHHRSEDGPVMVSASGSSHKINVLGDMVYRAFDFEF